MYVSPLVFICAMYRVEPGNRFRNNEYFLLVYPLTLPPQDEEKATQSLVWSGQLRCLWAEGSPCWEALLPLVVWMKLFSTDPRVWTLGWKLLLLLLFGEGYETLCKLKEQDNGNQLNAVWLSPTSCSLYFLTADATNIQASLLLLSPCCPCQLPCLPIRIGYIPLFHPGFLVRAFNTVVRK